MSELNVKYQLGTKENEAFLADVREGLFLSAITSPLLAEVLII